MIRPAFHAATPSGTLFARTGTGFLRKTVLLFGAYLFLMHSIPFFCFRSKLVSGQFSPDWAWPGSRLGPCRATAHRGSNRVHPVSINYKLLFRACQTHRWCRDSFFCGNTKKDRKRQDESATGGKSSREIKGDREEKTILLKSYQFGITFKIPLFF